MQIAKHVLIQWVILYEYCYFAMFLDTATLFYIILSVSKVEHFITEWYFCAFYSSNHTFFQHIHVILKPL